jgi:hypothetical protein
MVPLYFEQAVVRETGLRHEFPRGPEPTQLRSGLLYAGFQDLLDRVLDARGGVVMDLAAGGDEVGVGRPTATNPR